MTGVYRVRGRGAGVGAAVAGVGAAALLLAGCGVPTTGVVDVGVPASGLPAAPDTQPKVRVYFVDGERLAVARQQGKSGADPVQVAVTLLFAGPAAAGRPDLTTRLPHLAPVQVVTEGRTVTVTLPAGTPAPDALGVRQVACTVAEALVAGEASPLVPPAPGGSVPTTATPRPATPSIQLTLRAPSWHRTARTASACPA